MVYLANHMLKTTLAAAFVLLLAGTGVAGAYVWAGYGGMMGDGDGMMGGGHMGYRHMDAADCPGLDGDVAECPMEDGDYADCPTHDANSTDCPMEDGEVADCPMQDGDL